SFFTVLSLFEKYIARKNYQYYGVSDLILEIVKEDIKELSKYRSVLLNNISEDPQIEKLILSLFDNNLNITKTAKDVYMHRNTINNKLEYITKETGLNIQEFKDALSMYWLINAK
ncbi:MAG: helix-turn-helix domain-containing protein, partial [Candidatus Izemoplasmatales bacterium]|nr:helix-turn-helix domain-containing protein [Candidatus Izemoplasmatales bacterium]